MGQKLKQFQSSKGRRQVPMIFVHWYTNNLSEDAGWGVKKTMKYFGQWRGVDGKSCKRALNSEWYKESDGNECGKHFLCYSYKKERRERWGKYTRRQRVEGGLKGSHLFSVTRKRSFPYKYIKINDAKKHRLGTSPQKVHPNLLWNYLKSSLEGFTKILTGTKKERRTIGIVLWLSSFLIYTLLSSWSLSPRSTVCFDCCQVHVSIFV